MPWDAPALVGPSAPTGLSVLAISPDPGSSIGAMATWRHRTVTLDFGYRAAVAQGPASDVIGAVGVDVGGYAARQVEGSEIDVSWWTGLGAGLGDRVVASIPLGLVAGWTGDGGDALLSPYAGAHAVIDLAGEAGRRVTLDAAVDLGLEMTILPTEWIVRFGATLGGRNALAVGIRVPGGPPSDRRPTPVDAERGS